MQRHHNQRGKKKLFRFKKENELIKQRIIRDINNLFEQEEHYYKASRVGQFYSNNYIEYEFNGDRNKTLWIREYLDENKLYLKDTISNLKILIHGKLN